MSLLSDGGTSVNKGEGQGNLRNDAVGFLKQEGYKMGLKKKAKKKWIV